ncbi:SDR family oxidoreductase [Lentisphaerota bacterium WC36G]|nr:SDR family oxidoreductase [Lentisphaerae bacterium WC36]
MNLFLNDKTALVTGALKGLGKAICISLASEGVNIILNYRSNEKNDLMAIEFAKELEEKYSVKTLAIAADVSNENAVVKMFKTAVEKFNQIDILVNNAGVCPTSMVKDMPYDMFQQTLNINLNGTFLCCKEMSKLITANNLQAKIINIVSQAAFNGSATGKSQYSASKGAVVSFTLSLALELASTKTCVNAVAPGLIRTEMVAESLIEKEAHYNKTIPLGRIAEVNEIADAVTFLASEKANYITGSVLNISGGLLLR